MSPRVLSPLPDSRRLAFRHPRYDLSGFLAKHPGGRDWLELTKGQDITEAFEVHHLNMPKVNSVLKKMYVKDADKTYVGRYTWDQSGFYLTLKRRVCAAFEASDGGFAGSSVGTPYFHAVCAGAVLVHLLSFYMLLAVGGYTLAVLAGFTLQAFHEIGHNALHKADNAWMYVALQAGLTEIDIVKASLRLRPLCAPTRPLQVLLRLLRLEAPSPSSVARTVSPSPPDHPAGSRASRAVVVRHPAPALL